MKTSKAAMRAEDRIRKVYPNWPMRRIPTGGLSNIIEEETHLGELIQLVEDMDRLFQNNYDEELHGHMVWNADDVSLRDHVHSLLSRIQGKD